MWWFLSQVGKAIDCNSMIVGSNPTGTSNLVKPHRYAPLAQLDRVSDYESGGCEFDSCKARQMVITALFKHLYKNQLTLILKKYKLINANRKIHFLGM